MKSEELNEKVLVRVIDDDRSIRDSLTYLLTKAGFDCVAYPSARDFLTQDMPSVHGCAILDVRMPEMTGLELQSEMNKRGIRLPIIFFSGHGDLDMAVETLRKGATTFLQKTVSSDKLLGAVAEAVEISLAQETKRLSDTELMTRWDTLADHEKEVAELLGEGMLSRDIADYLKLSPKTVYNYKVEANRKLGTKSPADIARFVYRVKKIQGLGLSGDPEP